MHDAPRLRFEKDLKLEEAPRPILSRSAHLVWVSTNPFLSKPLNYRCKIGLAFVWSERCDLHDDQTSVVKIITEITDDRIHNIHRVGC